jgi:hypothetical protein
MMPWPCNFKGFAFAWKTHWARVDGNDGGREKAHESQLLTRLFLRTGEIESKE